MLGAPLRQLRSWDDKRDTLFASIDFIEALWNPGVGHDTHPFEGDIAIQALTSRASWFLPLGDW